MEQNANQSIYSELADFLVSQPTLNDIVAYQVPEGVQNHIDNLLEKNREEGLSADERIEMEKLLAVSHVISLAKAKARLKMIHKSKRL